MLAKAFFYLSIMVLLMVGAKWVNQHPYFRITQIHIVAAEGNDTLQRADRIKIFEAVRPALTGSFFDVDLQKARLVAQAQPWVKQVKIDRIAPNGIHIAVEEHQVAARWIREGFEAGMIGPDGTVFQAASNEKLPELDGEYGSHTLMLEQWRIFSAKLKPLRLQIKRLQYSPRAAWTIYLENGLEIRLGKENVHARLDRFIHFYRYELSSYVEAAEYVDMRYQDAAAVGWREGMKPKQPETAALE